METDSRSFRDYTGKFADFARSRSKTLRAELIEAHLWLPHHLARRFAHRGEPLDDLIQVGSMALVKAVDRFDPDRAVAFSTYATHTIVGEIKRHFRDKGWALRAPRRIQELYLEINRSVSTMSQQLGRSPTITELAQALEVSEEAVLEAQEAGNAYDFSSIDAPIPHEHESLSSRIGAVDPEFASVEGR
ncbi:MAG: sigma-70 family RNA polymerase sigma factor, partial [Acidimicrobiales bacterium]